jgi:hypothetical protein
MVSARPGSDPTLAATLPACMGDLRIVIGEVPRTLPGATAEGVLWQATPNRLLLEIPDTARLLVSRDDIVVTALAANALDNIGPFLRRTPLMAVMLMRGAFACNGAAVAGPDGAVLLLGPTAIGKSALAAALLKRGLRLLADDAAPIMLDASGRAVIASVWPELVLWPDTIEALFASDPPAWIEPLPPNPSATPYWSVASAKFCPHATPIKATYRIDREFLAGTVESSTVKGMAGLMAGTLLPYQGRIAAVLADPAAFLRIYGAVTAACSIQRIKLPHLDVSEVEDMAGRIMQDCEWPISI